MNYKKLWCTLLLSVSILHAGKDVSPAVVAVEPIPAEQPVPIYIGVGLVYGKYSGCTSPGCKYEDVTYGAMLRAGYEWNQYFGVEARMLATFWGADPLGGEKLQHIGIFAKPMYPLGEDFNVYGLLGYGWTKTTTELSGSLLPTLNQSGFSAGLGLEYDLSDKEDDFEEDTLYDRNFDGQADEERGWGLFVDYQRLLIDSNVPNLDVVSAGVTYDF
ncbi:MAG TPA: porin family protein [Epsilonproteobacteria bacterium]|nr:porin family protein [Campylobacterota bacterium]